MEHTIKNLIRNIPDFPKPGIQFKDITPVLADQEAFKLMIDWFALTIEAEGKPELVVGIESRGFIIGSALAYKMGLGFVPIRKPGKLPYKTRSKEYELEYGTDTLEIHIDAVQSGQRVVLVDDLLATGGTAKAAVQLLNECNAEVLSTLFLVELDFLNGRDLLKEVTSTNIHSLVHY